VLYYPFELWNACANGIARVVLLNYREDGVTPFVTIWKHGVKEEKV